MFISSLFMFHREKGIIDKSFPSERLQMAAVNDFRFYRGHENVGKRDCHFCTYCGTVCLKINRLFPFKWKAFSFKISQSISLR